MFFAIIAGVQISFSELGFSYCFFFRGRNYRNQAQQDKKKQYKVSFSFLLGLTIQLQNCLSVESTYRMWPLSYAYNALHKKVKFRMALRKREKKMKHSTEFTALKYSYFPKYLP
ncbi:hypothetical protein O6H91_01G048400 [Diphasiastrum complanatum]|uniref:Uncharacterized protein n=1 Tax=Diphasiastrum complanatum TaxID=34168 RepID=A0ACC2EQN7_DIPCM|nr:hypothetical protein O6H91_01G048400 [Diphasiastrum complanatum]